MKILFICKNNQFRSQMAAAIYNQLTGSTDASSAGTYVGASDAPEGALIEKFFRTADFFELMEEHSMQIRNNHMRKLTPQILKDSDVVISMAEEPYTPDFLREDTRVIWWDVENPTFVTREVAESIFQIIKNLVSKFIKNSNNGKV